MRRQAHRPWNRGGGIVRLGVRIALRTGLRMTLQIGRHIGLRTCMIGASLAAWPAAQASTAPPGAPAFLRTQVPFSIAFAEQPARLARGTSLYRAGRGAALRGQDLLEAGSAGAQLDARGATVALGPAARVYVVRDSELVLLDGWLKLHCPDGRALTVSTSRLQALCAGATVMLRARGGGTEVFAETGAAALHELDGARRGRAARVPDQHFAARGDAGPLHIAPRAPAAFIDAMPRGFRDQLVPLASGPAVPPQRERAARYAELAPWLAGQPALRERLARRFDPPRPAHTVRSTPPPPPSRPAARAPASANGYRTAQ